EVGGMPTLIPFHRAVLTDPDFIDEPFRVHTRWIETEWTGSVPAYDGDTASAGPDDFGERERITVEVGGRRLEVSLPGGLAAKPAASRGGGKPTAHKAASSKSAASGDSLTAPMQGTIVKVAVADGDLVEAGDLVVVLEAMKMEQPINAHQAGTVTGLTANVGDVVTAGAVVCEIKAAAE
ncbi:MAG TPA: biotin/lipoyl-containing protein, partial [Mycobacteriales bacterium]|nr:biotin/lipoyl-containing protein [Mycobacteriales bacterium]